MNHSITMTAGALLASLTLACAGRPASPPVVISIPDTLGGVPSPVLRRLQLQPGTFRYRISQRAHIQTVDSTASGTTTLAAILQADVVATSDSSFSLVISADSITLVTQGAIPASRTPQVRTIDSIAHAMFSPTAVTLISSFPDSLCGHNALTAAARELILPSLPPVVQLPATTIYADTSSTASCISEVILHNRAVRQVETSGSTLPEFRITQQTETTGAGIVRRDSVSVSGSVSSRGTASFHTTTRLPTSIDLTSEGRITVTLGVAHTTFLQTSSLTIRQIPRDSLSP